MRCSTLHRGQALLQTGGQIVHGGLENVVEQVFLAGVVIVDAGLLDAAAPGDVADAGGEIALFKKKIDGYGLDGRFHIGHGGGSRDEAHQSVAICGG
jgi:hypothetical protein